MLVEKQNVTGGVYRFDYNNQKRIVLVESEDDSNLYTWDFTKNDYRNFKKNRISCLIDVTDKCLIVPESQFSGNKVGPNLRVRIDNNKVYIVNLG